WHRSVHDVSVGVPWLVWYNVQLVAPSCCHCPNADAGAAAMANASAAAASMARTAAVSSIALCRPLTGLTSPPPDRRPAVSVYSSCASCSVEHRPDDERRHHDRAHAGDGGDGPPNHVG